MVRYRHSMYLSMGIEMKVPMSCEIVIRMGVYSPKTGCYRATEITWPACVT